MQERKFDAMQAGIRAVKATKDGQRLKVAVVFENNDFQRFRCGDMIENLLVPGTGILSGVICGVSNKPDDKTPHWFEFVAQYCRVEMEPREITSARRSE